jgi:hypothetical protein
MFSRALLTKLNCLDFRVLKGQSYDKVCLCKILWLPLFDAVSLWQHFAYQRNWFYT